MLHFLLYGEGTAIVRGYYDGNIEAAFEENPSKSINQDVVPRVILLLSL